MAPSFLKIHLSKHFKRLSRSSYLGNNLIESPHLIEEAKSYSKTIKLYDAHNIDHCIWPKGIDGQYAQKLLTPLIKKGVSTYIQNVHTDLRALVYGQIVLPITINDAEYENSYVCSPYSYYISYAKESLRLLAQNWPYHVMNALLWGVGKILRHYQVNKVVVVNNWLYSTNLYPHLQAEELIAIAKFLQKQFPDYAIVFRSIDPHTTPMCYQTLQTVGFEYIASRQIFFIDPHQTTLFESRLFKSDLRLLQNSGYEIIDERQLTEKDLSRLLGFYQDLYIHKYSDLNPKFSEDFLSLLLNEKLMRFKALKKNGRIDGAIGYVERNGVMLSPFFGYDRTLPKEIALYRLLSTVLMLEAHHHHLLFHQSSGASMFKKIRKANSCIEYMAVYHRHLSLKRRIPWSALKSMCNSLGIRYMKRY